MEEEQKAGGGEGVVNDPPEDEPGVEFEPLDD